MGVMHLWAQQDSCSTHSPDDVHPCSACAAVLPLRCRFAAALQWGAAYVWGTCRGLDRDDPPLQVLTAPHPSTAAATPASPSMHVLHLCRPHSCTRLPHGALLHPEGAARKALLPRQHRCVPCSPAASPAPTPCACGGPREGEETLHRAGCGAAAAKCNGGGLRAGCGSSAAWCWCTCRVQQRCCSSLWRWPAC